MGDPRGIPDFGPAPPVFFLSIAYFLLRNAGWSKPVVPEKFRTSQLTILPMPAATPRTPAFVSTAPSEKLERQTKKGRGLRIRQ
jgi:hypothetical protein